VAERSVEIELTLPGVEPPKEPRSSCDFLRPRYTKATVIVLARRASAGLENVRSIVVYGSSQLRPGPDRLQAIPAKGIHPEYLIVRRTVDAGLADKFIAEAIKGLAAPPSTAQPVRYRLEGWWEGLLPRGPLSGPPGPSASSSIWRRRRQPAIPGLLGTPVTMSTVASLVSRLPVLDEADWTLLDPRNDVSSFEALDELYPIPVWVHVTHRGSFMSAVVSDPQGWLPALGGGNLRVEGHRFGLRQSAFMMPIPKAGTYDIPLHDPAAETLLEAKGIALDMSGGWFVGVEAVVPPISGGDLSSVYELNRTAERWHGRARERLDVVFDPRRRGENPEPVARAALQHMLRSVAVPPKPASVDVMDPYDVPTAVLRAMAEVLPRGSTIRIIGGTGSFDADFPTVALSTGVSVSRYTPVPGISPHDRFLRIDGRLWSMGTSFNSVGHDFHAILEVRDPVTFGEIASVLDACLAASPTPPQVRSRSWCDIIRRWWRGAPS
jgi:hypothetical protein